MSKKYSKPNSALPAICGPFLRYQNVSPDSREWLGSALVVVRSSQDAAGEGTPAKSGQEPVHYPTSEASCSHGPSAGVAARRQPRAGSQDCSVQLLLDTSSNVVHARQHSPPRLSSTAQASPHPRPTQHNQPLKSQQAQLAGQVIKAELLDRFGGWEFLRFDLRIPFTASQQQVRYSLLIPDSPTNWSLLATSTAATGPSLKPHPSPPDVRPSCAAAEEQGSAGSPGVAPGGIVPTGWKLGGSYAFWVPALGQPMHAGYYSCSGISADVSPDSPERSDPCYLWRDLLGLHSAFPLHVLIGGGDQVYSDPIWRVPELEAWTSIASKSKRLSAPWTQGMAQAAEDFYARNYLEGFQQPLQATALASIPQVMMWDDHDIWDGWGSYPDALQRCSVFQGLFAVAKRAYLLFQQHTTEEANMMRGELLGQGEFHFLKSLGPQVALLGVDMRTQRQLRRVMPQTLDTLLQGLPATVEHLLVMSGVPLIFPKVPWMETLLVGLESAMDGSRTVRGLVKKAGLADQFAHPGILDDLVDGWAANMHKEEKLAFVRLLQSVSERRGVRVSILSGDAHVCGVGRLYSRPKPQDPSQDPLFMTQIISSAIMNAPPPQAVTLTLNRTSRAQNLDHRTREKMVRVFGSRHPKFPKLLRMRNWQGHAEEIYEIWVPRLQGRVLLNAA